MILTLVLKGLGGITKLKIPSQVSDDTTAMAKVATCVAVAMTTQSKYVNRRAEGKMVADLDDFEEPRIIDAM